MRYMLEMTTDTTSHIHCCINNKTSALF